MKKKPRRKITKKKSRKKITKMRNKKRVGTARRISFGKRKRNPDTFNLPLTDFELDGLIVASNRYTSAMHLLNAYDAETGSWDLEIVERALEATLDDGGGFGIVPFIGNSTQNKVSQLFQTISDF